ncbi:hypothetical protein Ahy_B06g081789 [Arachis hypogaea]|uniref:Uncharacterized protein n=1 Tax=Arachis hypogaea TaxID=3818 RepID=A0A444YM46_ARAHY|nr:hypothetical protein Ahy_B06g081789 [Arachis hypogaea]
MLDDVRQGRDHWRQWLRPDIKKALFVHWEIDEGFRHRRPTNRTNRASVRSSRYTGSSMTFMKMVMLIFAGSRSDVSGDIQVHPHAEEEKRDICLSVRPRLNNFSKVGRTPPLGAAVIDPDAVWRETASVPYKNRVYRMGSFFASSLRTFILRPSSGSTTSRAVEPEE